MHTSNISTGSFTSPRAATKDFLEKRKTLACITGSPLALHKPIRPQDSSDGNTSQSLLDDETYKYYMNYERLLEQLLQITCGDPLSKMYEFQYPEYHVLELDTSIYHDRQQVLIVCIQSTLSLTFSSLVCLLQNCCLTFKGTFNS